MTDNIHDSWQDIVSCSLKALPQEYRNFLDSGDNYIPEKSDFLNAFKTLPKDKLRYILFGQDPYPRAKSASGYAFIDGAVKHIFSASGFDKNVNKATSLRNFIKMVLVSDGKLSCKDSSQKAIASIDKSDMIDSIDELRCNFEHSGVLLLNSSLIFTSKKESKKHIKIWRAFVERFLEQVQPLSPKLIFFGNYAKEIKKLPSASGFESIELEHPYNHTFVCNKKAQELFGAMKLLHLPKSKV